MAWYDEVERNLRKSREDSAEWEKKAVNWANETVDPWLLKTIPRGFWEWNRRNPEVSDKAGSGLRYVGRSLQQQRPRYEPWQNQMVDPNWGGGKFGSSGGVGGGAALWGLPGIGLSRLPIRGIPSAFKKQLSPQQLLRQMQRRLRGRDPRIDPRIDPRMYGPVRPRRGIIRSALRPQYGGPRGGRFRGQRYGPNKTLDDLRRDYDDVLR